jgi:cytochrome c5
MNKCKLSKAPLQTTLAAVIAVLVIGGLASTLWSADPKTDAPPPKTDSAPSKTNSVGLNAKSPEAKKAAVKRQITGAELYSMHCNRCHPERYPTERTAAQWKTIMLHMQIRANLHGEQARMILKYLQENSGR